MPVEPMSLFQVQNPNRLLPVSPFQ
jgi:hypothetical protein